MKIRAVGLANPIVKWLDQNLRGIKDFYEISMNSGDTNPEKVLCAKNFVLLFFKILKKENTAQKLIRLIRDCTACFGPKRLGPNILINKF